MFLSILDCANYLTDWKFSYSEIRISVLFVKFWLATNLVSLLRVLLSFFGDVFFSGEPDEASEITSSPESMKIGVGSLYIV